jgi:hypothetical protein
MHQKEPALPGGAISCSQNLTFLAEIWTPKNRVRHRHGTSCFFVVSWWTDRSSTCSWLPQRDLAFVAFVKEYKCLADGASVLSSTGTM